jgi:hypothetical protein
LRSEPSGSAHDQSITKTLDDVATELRSFRDI